MLVDMLVNCGNCASAPQICSASSANASLKNYEPRPSLQDVLRGPPHSVFQLATRKPCRTGIRQPCLHLLAQRSRLLRDVFDRSATPMALAPSSPTLRKRREGQESNEALDGEA
eukprot:6204083-Pleurochrysis_carterae.AAC.3